MTTNPVANVGWGFPPTNGGKIDGFNEASIDTFIGNRTYSVVRETIQNSLDVQADPDQAVEVHFRFDELPINTVDAVKSLDSFLLAAKRAATKDAKATEFYNNALRILTEYRTVQFLSIHDSNATGLTGNAEVDLEAGEVSPWFALVKGSGVSVKKGKNAGGSYGHGSKATLSVSQLRSVFYLSFSNDAYGASGRFQGKSILQSMQNESLKTQGTGFYGTIDDLGPLVGDEVPAWANELRNEVADGTGTSIFIPFPDLHFGEDNWLDIEAAVLANFYYAIEQNKLYVTLGNGEILSADTLGARFEALCERLGEAGELQDLQSSMTIYSAHKSGSYGSLDSSEFGRVDWFLRLGDEIETQRVGISRNGMLITRSAPFLQQGFGGLKKFDLFLAVEGEEGKTLLRKLENPAHNEFNFDRIQDQEESKKAKARFKRFAVEVKAFLKENAALEIADEMTIGDLDDIFGDIGETPESGAPLDTVGESDAVVVKQPKKKKPIEGALSDDADDDGIGEEGGVQSGDGTRQPDPPPGEGGHGPTEGGKSTHPKVFTGRQVKDLRVVPASEAPGAIRVFFTPVVDGEFQFSLFRSGDSVREPIQFKTSLTGEFKTSIPLKAKKKLERIQVLLYLDADDLHNTFEGVMK